MATNMPSRHQSDEGLVRDFLLVYDKDDPEAITNCENLATIFEKFVKIPSREGSRNAEIYLFHRDFLGESTDFDKLEEACDKTVYIFIVLTRNFARNPGTKRLMDEILAKSFGNESWTSNLIVILPLTRSEMKALNYQIPFGLKSIKPINVSNLVRRKRLCEVRVQDLQIGDLQEDIMEKIQILVIRGDPEKESKEARVRDIETHAKNIPRLKTDSQNPRAGKTNGGHKPDSVRTNHTSSSVVYTNFVEPSDSLDSDVTSVTSNGAPVACPSHEDGGDVTGDLAVTRSGRIYRPISDQTHSQPKVSNPDCDPTGSPAQNHRSVSDVLQNSAGNPVKSDSDCEMELNLPPNLEVDSEDVESLPAISGDLLDNQREGNRFPENSGHSQAGNHPTQMVLHLREDALDQLDESDTSGSSRSFPSSSESSSGLRSLLSFNPRYMFSDDLSAVASLASDGMSSLWSSLRNSKN